MFAGLPVSYKQVTQAATATVKPTMGDVYGVNVVSSTSGTVTIRDGGASGTVVYASGTLTAGQVIDFGGCGIRCGTDIHVTVGGTATINVLYQ